jgi:hypothetical protein
MMTLNRLTESQLMVSSSSRVEVELGEPPINPSFFSEKRVKLLLLTHCISAIERANGLLLGGLDKGMSHHYSTQDQARSLLVAEAGARNKMEKEWKLALLLQRARMKNPTSCLAVYRKHQLSQAG